MIDCPVQVAISSGNISDCSTAKLEDWEPLDGECETLQQVLDLISATSYPANCTAVYVHAGNHYLTSPVNFSNEHVNIIGVGDNVSVICNYSMIHGSSGSEYMWLFENTVSVTLQNIEFYECPYPFRMLYVQNIYVTDSVFR